MKSLYKKLALAFIAVAVYSCGQKQPAEETQATESKVPADELTLTPDQYTMTEIVLGSIESRNLSHVLKVNGKIDVPPQNEVYVSAPLGGYVKSAGLLSGQSVQKGQVIAVIENPQFIDMQQEYLEAKSRLEYLKQEYARQEQLRKEDINSAKTFQQVKSEYQAIQAKINGLEQKLSIIGINQRRLVAGRISKTANLYSPITGFVKVSNAAIGKYVNPTDVLFELASKDDLHVALNVFQKDAAQLSIGQPIKFAMANEEEYNQNGKIILIGKAIEKEGTILVHCHITGSAGSKLLPGMYVKALIETASEKTPALPVEAFVQSEAADYIFIQTAGSAKGYQFKMVPVKKGVEEDGFAEVILPEKFDNASKIVTKGAYTLLSAMKNIEE